MPQEEHATVIYNAESGNGSSDALDDIEQCLADQGIEPTVHRTESEADLDGILPDARGLVVVCGGDGTLSAVFERVAGRDDVRIAPLPIGTANNLGHALGIPSDPSEALADLASRTPQALDLGTVRQAGRSAGFLEGFGCGLFAELLHAYDPDQGKSVMRAFETLVDVLPSFDPVTVSASVDGHDVSGEYLVFTVMNTKRIGPRIELAPNAAACDGELDVVAVKPEGRSSLVTYAQARLGDEIGEIDGVVLRRGRHVEIAPDGYTFHRDTETFETSETDEDSDAPITVAVDAGAVSIVIPDSCA